MTIRKYLILLLMLGLMASGTACRLGRRNVTHGFYYWKSIFQLTPAEQTTLQSVNIQRIYVKFFDVTWDKRRNRPSPVSPIRFQRPIPQMIAIIPTVYLTNETLTQLPLERLPGLAEGITHKIHQLIETNHLPDYPEIQLDCDWTVTTANKFFTLLTEVKQRLPAQTVISATIRLHQITYQKRTGVPPVDRGVLMFYNLSYPGALNVKNSIIDLKTGQAYLDRISDYPLPLDIALPIYSWGVLFQGNQYRGLINNVTVSQLRKNPDFTKDGNFFTAQRNTYLNQTYVYKNDRIRVDESQYQEVYTASKYLSHKIKSKQLNVILFHLDRQLLRRFPNEKLQTIFRSFN